MPTKGKPRSFFPNTKKVKIRKGFFGNVVYHIQTTNKAILFLLFLVICGILRLASTYVHEVKEQASTHAHEVKELASTHVHEVKQLASTHLHEVNEGHQKVVSSILDQMTRRPREQPKTLNDRVAVNAILNDGGRADNPKCYPGTREEVIRNIERWIDNSNKHNRMLWLSGPAGGGKTAIMKTIAERSKAQARGVRTINFFFFRADHTRNGPWSFVSTLLYQIVQHYPATSGPVASIVADDPLLLDTSIPTQFSKLVYPLADIIRASSADSAPIVLLIDGLDECDVNVDAKRAQDDILHALGSLVSQTDSPFIALVASRPEPQIEMSFNRLPLNSSHIFLNDQYRPEKDIRHFVMEKFNLIKQTHPKAGQLPENWPSNSDVNGIVVKSSGQFIYAATVMRFLECAFTVPTLSLERLQGIHASTAKMSPFAELDAVYAHILGQTEDWETTQDILSTKLFDDNMFERLETTGGVYTAIRITCGDQVSLQLLPRHTNNTQYLQYLANDGACTTEDVGGVPVFRIPPLKDILAAYDSKYTDAMVESAVSYLAALGRLQGGNLVFYHASFSEFLRDPSRSGSLYINLEEFTQRALPALWASKLTFSVHEMFPNDICLFHLPAIHQMEKTESASHGPMGWQLLHHIQQTTPAITQAMLTGHTSEWGISVTRPAQFMVNRLLKDISRLYYPHDIKSYKQILRKWCIWVNGQNTVPDLVELGVPFLQTYLFLAKIERRLTLPNWGTLDTTMHIVYPPTGVSFLDTFLSFLATIEHQQRRTCADVIKDLWTKIDVSIFMMAVMTTMWTVTRSGKIG